MKDQLKSQLAKGEIEKVLHWLTENPSDPQEEAFFLSLTARWNHLNHQKSAGTISHSEETLERNKIHEALIHFLSNGKVPHPQAEDSKSSQNQQITSSKIDVKNNKLDSKGGDINIGGIINK